MGVHVTRITFAFADLFEAQAGHILSSFTVQL